MNKWVLLFIVFLSFVLPLRAQDDAKDFALKSAYIYKMASYVKWKAVATPQFTLGVVGNTEGGAISIPSSKTVGTKTVLIKNITNLSDMLNCKVVYIGASEKAKLPTILAALKGQEILTVGDVEGFADKGVMINFVKRNNKIVFEINLKEIKAAGIAMDSQLYELAARLVE